MASPDNFAVRQKGLAQTNLQAINRSINQYKDIKSDAESRESEQLSQLDIKQKEQRALATEINSYNDAVEPGKLFRKLDNPRDRKVVKVKVGDKTLYYQKKDNYTRVGDVMTKAEGNTN